MSKSSLNSLVGGSVTPGQVEPGSGASGDGAPDPRIRIPGMPEAVVRGVHEYRYAAEDDDDGRLIVALIVDVPYSFGPDLVITDADKVVIA